MITCMLNDFKEKVIILIVNIVKYQIFLCRLNKWIPEYVDCLEKIKRERDFHLAAIKPIEMRKCYAFWGALISDTIFKNESELWW